MTRLLQSRVADEVGMVIQAEPIAATSMDGPSADIGRKAGDGVGKVRVNGEFHVTRSGWLSCLRIIGQAEVGDALVGRLAPEIVQWNGIILAVKAPKPINHRRIGVIRPKLLPALGQVSQGGG